MFSVASNFTTCLANSLIWSLPRLRIAAGEDGIVVIVICWAQIETGRAKVIDRAIQ